MGLLVLLTILGINPDLQAPASSHLTMTTLKTNSPLIPYVGCFHQTNRPELVPTLENLKSCFEDVIMTEQPLSEGEDFHSFIDQSGRMALKSLIEPLEMHFLEGLKVALGGASVGFCSVDLKTWVTDVDVSKDPIVLQSVQTLDQGCFVLQDPSQLPNDFDTLESQGLVMAKTVGAASERRIENPTAIIDLWKAYLSRKKSRDLKKAVKTTEPIRKSTTPVSTNGKSSGSGMGREFWEKIREQALNGEMDLTSGGLLTREEGLAAVDAYIAQQLENEGQREEPKDSPPAKLIRAECACFKFKSRSGGSYHADTQWTLAGWEYFSKEYGFGADESQARKDALKNCRERFQLSPSPFQRTFTEAEQQSARTSNMQLGECQFFPAK